MDDLIRRKDAIDALEREKTYCTAFRDGYTPINVFEKYNAGLTDGIKVLKNLPSAQPEIIRCKDCKHYVIHVLFGHQQGWCERLCDEYDKSLARGTMDDDFCSKGREEKRMRKCNYCGKPMPKCGGCALAITSIGDGNVNMINVSFCDKDYKNFIEPILKELNNVGDLHMIFGDEEKGEANASNRSDR